MQLTTSPLAPTNIPNLQPINGLQLVTAESGLKYKKRPDLFLAVFDEYASIAGVFTKSKTASANVMQCQDILPNGKIKALIINSGNSNAFTGGAGDEGVKLVRNALAEQLNTNINNIYTAATGVIGEPFDHDQYIAQHIPHLKNKLDNNYNWQLCAEAITTTDTFIKLASHTYEDAGNKITINGIAKGSGMIAPDMATMIGFIATDAAIDSPALQALLTEVNEESFNSITVDSDTSTSDSVFLAATNKVPCTNLDKFKQALKVVMLDLAQQIVRDGEGATKFVTIKVTGAQSDSAAKNIALSIANSPLVKTAIAGEDPNWGRIVMAVGKSAEAANRDKLAIYFGDIKVAENGAKANNYTEQQGANYFKQQELKITTDVGVGKGAWQVYTCDLTHGYISINADYRS